MKYLKYFENKGYEYLGNVNVYEDRKVTLSISEIKYIKELISKNGTIKLFDDVISGTLFIYVDKEKSAYFFDIYKQKDDWYIMGVKKFGTGKESVYYKCDQISGIEELISDTFNINENISYYSRLDGVNSMTDLMNDNDIIHVKFTNVETDIIINSIKDIPKASITNRENHIIITFNTKDNTYLWCRIFKTDDEWFYVNINEFEYNKRRILLDYCNNTYYKCDQIQGVTSLIEDNKNIIKRLIIWK